MTSVRTKRENLDIFNLNHVNILPTQRKYHMKIRADGHLHNTERGFRRNQVLDFGLLASRVARK